MKLLADIKDVFGTIVAPSPIAKLSGGDPTGAGGIGKFLSNVIVLIYTVSGIVLIIMLLWGAFDWIISEGDKEKLTKAQQKLISAFVGILILAAAFAVISVLGAFTGFRFFEGQGIQNANDPTGAYKWICPDGTKVGGDVGTFQEACGAHGYK